LEGAAAPPPPAAADPAPVVVEAGADDPTAVGAFSGVLEAWDMGPTARSRHLEWPDRGWTWGYAWSDVSVSGIAGFVTEVDPPDPRLAGFRSLWGPAAERLLTALARGFAADGGLALLFLGRS
jgi:hypothetical protein